MTDQPRNAVREWRNIQSPLVRRIVFIGSLRQGAVISRGSQYEAIVADAMRSSGQFDNVETNVKLDLGEHRVGRRKIQQVDIVGHTMTSVKLFNVKSRNVNHTNDHGMVVKALLAAQLAMQMRFPDKNVRYVILRVGGEKIAAYESVGVQTFDVDEYMTTLLKTPFNIEQRAEPAFEAMVRQRALELSREYTGDETYGVETLQMLEHTLYG